MKECLVEFKYIRLLCSYVIDIGNFYSTSSAQRDPRYHTMLPYSYKVSSSNSSSVTRVHGVRGEGSRNHKLCVWCDVCDDDG